MRQEAANLSVTCLLFEIKGLGAGEYRVHAPSLPACLYDKPAGQLLYMPAPTYLGILTAEESVNLAPRTGVEVVGGEERDGGSFYTVRDLRNGNMVKNVTLKSARRLWHYALTQYASLPSDIKKAKIQWEGDFGLLHQGKQGKRPNYDLIQRIPQGYRYFFGVTDDGIHGPWKKPVGQEEE